MLKFVTLAPEIEKCYSIHFRYLDRLLRSTFWSTGVSGNLGSDVRGNFLISHHLIPGQYWPQGMSKTTPNPSKIGPDRAQARAHVGLVFVLSPQPRPQARPPTRPGPQKPEPTV
jgi:hypothetical protein